MVHCWSWKVPHSSKMPKVHTQSTQSTHRHTNYLHAHIYTCTHIKNTKCIHTHTRYTYTVYAYTHTHTNYTHTHTKVHIYTQSTCSKTHTQIMKSTQVEFWLPFIEVLLTDSMPGTVVKGVFAPAIMATTEWVLTNLPSTPKAQSYHHSPVLKGNDLPQATPLGHGGDRCDLSVGHLPLWSTPCSCLYECACVYAQVLSHALHLYICVSLWCRSQHIMHLRV